MCNFLMYELYKKARMQLISHQFTIYNLHFLQFVWQCSKFWYWISAYQYLWIHFNNATFQPLYVIEIRAIFSISLQITIKFVYLLKSSIDILKIGINIGILHELTANYRINVRMKLLALQSPYKNVQRYCSKILKHAINKSQK